MIDLAKNILAVVGICTLSVLLGIGFGYGQALFEHLHCFDEDDMDD